MQPNVFSNDCPSVGWRIHPDMMLVLPRTVFVVPPLMTLSHYVCFQIRRCSGVSGLSPHLIILESSLCSTHDRVILIWKGNAERWRCPLAVISRTVMAPTPRLQYGPAGGEREGLHNQNRIKSPLWRMLNCWINWRSLDFIIKCQETKLWDTTSQVFKPISRSRTRAKSFRD